MPSHCCSQWCLTSSLYLPSDICLVLIKSFDHHWSVSYIWRDSKSAKIRRGSRSGLLNLKTVCDLPFYRISEPEACSMGEVTVEKVWQRSQEDRDGGLDRMWDEAHWSDEGGSHSDESDRKLLSACALMLEIIQNKHSRAVMFRGISLDQMKFPPSPANQQSPRTCCGPLLQLSHSF